MEAKSFFNSSLFRYQLWRDAIAITLQQKPKLIIFYLE